MGRESGAKREQSTVSGERHRTTTKMVKSGEAVTREYTINLHKRLHGITFKKRARRAIKEIRTFAQKEMKTSDVRLDVKLNRAVWANGVKNGPRRLRIQIQRRKNDDEDASEEMYSIVTAVDGVAVSQPTVVVEQCKGKELQTIKPCN